MKFRDEVILTVLIIWLLLNSMPFMLGLIDENVGFKCGPMRRIEVVIPGYRVGRWLMEPFNKGVINVQKR